MRQLKTHCLGNDPTRLGRKKILAWKIERNKTKKAFSLQGCAKECILWKLTKGF